MPIRRRPLLAILAASPLPRLAAAQESPIRIVFPFAAGGGGDAVTRLLAEHLRDRLGRPVIVENRAGGGGRIGAQAVKAAMPDGAMLLMAAATQMVLQPHTDQRIGYDPFTDFRPVAQVVRFSQVVVIGPDNPARSVADLIAWFRADPARRNFGSPGLGTGAHFAGVEFGRLAGISLEHVAYRGTPAAIPDLQSGRLAMYVASHGEFREHHRAGRVRILASTDAVRSPGLADVPTLVESGMEVIAPGWFALYAPSATPPAVIVRLTDAVSAVLRDAALRDRIVAMGFEPTALGPADLAREQRAEYDRWGAVVRASGFQPAS